jgi:hypothetical protein
MIDSLPLDLFDNNDGEEKPEEQADVAGRCQWCAAAFPAGAMFCAECGGRVAAITSAPVPGLTELTPEQARAERKPLRPPDPGHWADADDPLPLVAAVAAVELTIEAIRNRRAKRGVTTKVRDGRSAGGDAGNG